MKIINIKNNSTLEEFLNEVNNPSLLRVYSNNCGHCSAMEDDWEKLKKLINEKNSDDNINIIDVESSYSNKLPSNISSSIIGYPTIIALQNGNIVKDYQGNRQANDMYDFCKEYLLKKSLASTKKLKLKGGQKLIRRKSIRRKSIRRKSIRRKSITRKSIRRKSITRKSIRRK